MEFLFKKNTVHARIIYNFSFTHTHADTAPVVLFSAQKPKPPDKNSLLSL
jgi:hypothetical protein